MILRNTSRLGFSGDPSIMASHLRMFGPVPSTGFFLPSVCGDEVLTKR